jgi:hypothetical protein
MEKLVYFSIMNPDVLIHSIFETLSPAFCCCVPNRANLIAVSPATVILPRSHEIILYLIRTSSRSYVGNNTIPASFVKIDFPLMDTLE